MLRGGRFHRHGVYLVWVGTSASCAAPGDAGEDERRCEIRGLNQGGKGGFILSGILVMGFFTLHQARTQSGIFPASARARKHERGRRPRQEEKVLEGRLTCGRTSAWS
ncbi:hypothetical protein LZ30DRAFT_721331 [Colletotrichum cereale]|nr:hypothetical protein LZ30DRAFT_721331 [Colletotrichum cereale]